ncbi:hypothetical protein EDB92DRAFT_1802543 [Lactarius akahatsu]|uniref:F-box domain-containing protein n=1 Tax=Lactarius akahatsu TaxID=416441 RepID=A0AAD4LDG6_9AGAM|nr:hypothetical protein EDB92DRAFT_1802543 [Lactarius akahatsu]
MLLNLPVKILSEVLVLLDHLSILRCSAACRQLHALVAASLNLQYRIELAAEGFIDGPPGGPASTAAARMDLLLERRVAWRVMRPRRRAAVALAGRCNAYELAGGLFAKAVEEHGAARRLVASWLPSNSADETRLVVDDLGVRIKDFALDPAQDLIVLLEHPPAVGLSASPSAAYAGTDICVHLRKLSAGAVAPHPAVKVSVLCRRSPGPVRGCMIQIVEDVVGMYFWMPLHGVLIWNWMAGEELVVRLLAPTLRRIWDFSFLSPRAYMVTTLKDGGEIRIYSLASPSSSRRPTHVATLHLPAPHPNHALFELTTTTGPFLARPPAGSPFSFSRTARVHVFTMHHDPGAHRGRWQPACFVVHNRTLMRYVETYRDDGSGAVDVPWEEWGPAGTRFFVLANGFQWLRYVHGTRVVCPVLQPSGESRVEVVDLNVHRSRAPTAAETIAASRLGIDLEEPIEGSQLVCEPSVLPAGGVFAKEVVTRLPYYSVPAPGQREPCGDI